jgi:hypothetical protein
LNSWYPIENVINSAYRKVLDFKENAEKILEKEKLETLCLPEFSKAILECKLIYTHFLYCFVTMIDILKVFQTKQNKNVDLVY